MELNLFDSPCSSVTETNNILFRPKFKLSEFFVGLNDLERYDIVSQRSVLTNLFSLVQIMSLIRDHANMPITITSGWRSHAHNSRVGGVRNSQHLTGSACDFKTYAPDRIHQIVPWIRKNIEFGQLIHYDNFLHISLPNGDKVNQYIDKRTLIK